MTDGSIVKIANNVSHDVTMLTKKFPQLGSISGAFELDGKRKLSVLVKEHLGMYLDKAIDHRAWEAPRYNERQRRYSATDAWVHWRLDIRLRLHPPAPMDVDANDGAVGGAAAVAAAAARVVAAAAARMNGGAGPSSGGGTLTLTLQHLSKVTPRTSLSPSPNPNPNPNPNPLTPTLQHLSKVTPRPSPSP